MVKEVRQAMKIGLVCSPGGHLTDMVELREAFEGHEIFWVTYLSKSAETLAEHSQVYQMENIGASPVRLLKSIWPAWQILRREKPAWVVSTGSEIALPFFWLAKLLHIKTIYIECVCRVTTASQTGKLLYPITTHFFVQWPGLVKVYGTRARYDGGVL
jgi:UDP-N-acetylglucosamine:LPS N-acetylglucosamine transferase